MISIAIVSLDNVDFLRLLLKGIRRNTTTPYEVLIYGNAAGHPPGRRHINPPGLSIEFVELIAQNRDIISVFIPSDTNDGISTPLNTLFAHAKGEYFVFLDDDMYVAPGWDTAVLQKVNPNILHQYLAFSQFIAAAPDSQYFNTYDFGGNPVQFREEDFNREWEDRRNNIKDHTMLAGCFCVKRKLWESVGGFWTTMPIYGCDIEFKIHIYKDARAENLPFEFRTVADSCVYHFNNGSHKKADYSGKSHPNPNLITNKHKMSPSEWEIFTQGLNQYFQ